MNVLVLLSLSLSHLFLATAWDYQRNGGDWSPLGQCGAQGQQSPINLPASAPPAAEELTMFLKYPALQSSVTVYNNGNSIALTMPDDFRAGFGLGKASDGPKIFQESEDADAYRLWQVNFHSPSEHTVNGEHLPLEMQLMHQQVTGGEGLAVVVVLFNAVPNAYGELLDSIIGKGLPEKPWEEALRKPSFQFAPVLGGSEFYSYEGSLTVPPCEHKVRYFVRKEAIPAAHAQLTEFTKVLQDTCGPNGNFRLVQPLSSPVSLVGTVDLITAPDKIIKPRVAVLPEEKKADTDAFDARCNPKDFDDAYKKAARLAVGDNDELVAAKTAYRAAELNEHAARNAVIATERTATEAKRIYDATPGIVDKMHKLFDVKAAEWNVEVAKKAVPAAEKRYIEQKKNVKKLIMKECIKRHTAEHAKDVEKEQKAPIEVVEKAKAAAKRQYEYPKPNVNLPRGMEGSPFSNRQPEGHKVVMSDKIAANLKQPDAPESSTIQDADGQVVKAAVAHSKAKILDVRLPVAYATGDSSSFKKDLVKAMAKISRVSEDRLEVAETHKVQVAKVHHTKPFSDEKEDKAQEKGGYRGPLTQKLVRNQTMLLSGSSGDIHQETQESRQRSLRHGRL